MLSCKIVAALALTALLSTTHCSIIAPVAVAAPPLIKYTHVAPPNIHPFAAQVSTFTRGLNILAAPYAAGVHPVPPAIVQRALLPAHLAPVAAPVPAHLAPVPAHLAPVPAHLAPVPAHFAPVPAPIAPVHAPVAAPYAPVHGHAAPVHGHLAAFPLLPAPPARSVYAVAPAWAPALPGAPLLG